MEVGAFRLFLSLEMFTFRGYNKHVFLEVGIVESNSLLITQIQKISAIYCGLFQSGYNYFSIERSHEHIALLYDFIGESSSAAFFSEASQNTCDVYSYWPRAYIMEAASFYLDDNNMTFRDFGTFHRKIMSAGNISEKERDGALWNWISKFPKALSDILSGELFSRYMEWEKKWIAEQNNIHKQELELIERCLDCCVNKWKSPVQSIQICINPIKCVYSSDYHLVDSCFIFSSGAFRKESIIHEFLHHVVHPAVEQQKEAILMRRPMNKYLDDSYYLSGDDAGIINGFEETVVRLLTEKVMNRVYPKDLLFCIKTILEES